MLVHNRPFTNTVFYLFFEKPPCRLDVLCDAFSRGVLRERHDGMQDNDADIEHGITPVLGLGILCIDNIHQIMLYPLVGVRSVVVIVIEVVDHTEHGLSLRVGLPTCSSSSVL